MKQIKPIFDLIYLRGVGWLIAFGPISTQRRKPTKRAMIKALTAEKEKS